MPLRLEGEMMNEMKGLNNMDLIITLKELEASLKVHPSVTTLFREAPEQEIHEFLRTTPEKTYRDAWHSLVSNINALSYVNYEKDENGSTKKVINCVSTLKNTITKDSSFPKKVFQTDENKRLLINVASMVNLFGVNCVIYHDISQFIDDNLNRV